MTVRLEDITGKQITCALSITSGSPISVEIAASLGFRALVIDAEHGPVSPYSHEMASMVRAADITGTPVFARLPEATPGCINRTLNDGVSGVIVPRVTTAADAQAAADASRYPAVGKRGAAPVVRAAGYGVRDWNAYKAESTDRRMVLCLLGSETATTNAEEILSVSGIDGVVLDIATLAREKGKASGAVGELIHAGRVASLAGSSGMTCGAIVQCEADAREWKSAGCNLIIVESDTSVALRAMTDALATLKGGVGA
ncbi:aldolase/citrate lyase family protein [Nocardioides sp. L-11A]|uniref:aldolase/citrate lyase family protein n=1 Tax=Nocardioides sp. L-11A TaxID=3043848 RepID=UPI00249A95E6|nr:aldolase/citrate lyase family protein [Nocardioides sp. L-11A]